MMRARILVVDDEEDMCFFLQELLEKEGYEVETSTSAEELLSKIRGGPFDLVIMDVRLPGMSGIQAIKMVKDVDPETIVIIMTAYGSKEVALEALRAGAYDYFTKPLNIQEMGVVVKRAVEKKALQKEIEALQGELRTRCNFSRIVGNSSEMRKVFQQIERLASTDSTALIYGESGTGKELVAEAIHYHSPRKDKPLVKLNCAAIPESLLESELFGFEKGAFTGAYARKLGKFELAHEGTIFLDEIADMSLATQAKILRVLEEKEIERLGGEGPVKVDVRIIAATNRDLWEAAQKGKFRSDLYFRLNVVPIFIPPLRERKEDIPLLVEHFLKKINLRLNKKITGITPEVMGLFMKYNWPGNVRELENCIERAVIMTEGPRITRESLPLYLQFPEEEKEVSGDLLSHLQRVERDLLIEALEKAGGIQSRAAKMLGITQRSLWHRVKKLGIDVQRIKQRKM